MEFSILWKLVFLINKTLIKWKKNKNFFYQEARKLNFTVITMLIINKQKMIWNYSIIKLQPPYVCGCVCVCVLSRLKLTGIIEEYGKMNFVRTLLLCNIHTNTYGNLEAVASEEVTAVDMLKMLLLPTSNTMRYSSDLRCMRCLLLKVNSYNIISM